MFHKIFLDSLITKTIRYSTVTPTSITIESTDNFDTITEQVKSQGITKLIIGSSLQELPIFDGLRLVRYLEIQSTQFESIPEEAFSNNQNIQSVVLSSSITNISAKAFSNSFIPQINLENVISIESEAFSNCSNLEVVTLSSVQTLGSYCFSNTAVIEIQLSDSITAIPEYAFYNCHNLTTFISNCNSFGSYSFYNCTSLTTFNYNFMSLQNFGTDVLTNTALEELSIPSWCLYDSQIKQLPLKKLTVSSNNNYIDRDNIRHYYYQYDFDLSYLSLETIEYTKDSNLIIVYNLPIKEIITPKDPDFRCRVAIGGCPNLVNLPNNIEEIFYIGSCPEIEIVDLSICTHIGRNSFFNCPKRKHIIGWGDHPMTVEPSLFELCPLIDINSWTSNIAFARISREMYYPLENTYIKELIINATDVPIFRNCMELEKVTFVEGSGLSYIG